MKNSEKKWWHVLPLSRRLRLQFALLTMGALGAAGLAYLSPLVQRRFINLLSARSGEAWTFLWVTAALFGATHLVNGWIKFSSSLWANAIALKLKGCMAHRALSLPYGVLKHFGGGYLAARLNADAETIQTFLSDQLFPAVVNAGRLTGALAFFLWFDWRAAAGVLPFILIHIGIVRYFQKRNRQLSHEILESRAASQRTAGDLFGRVALIKSKNAEREAVLRMSGTFRRQAILRAARVRLGAFYLASGNLVQPLAQGILLIIGVYFILNGRWDLGTLWALNCYLVHLLSPVRALCGTAFHLENVRAAAERIRDLTEREREDSGGDLVPTRLQGKIELDNLTFAYPGKPSLFDHTELTVAPRDHAAVTGMSGSGKSTLAALLTGLYRPQDGEIRFDGIPLERYRLSALRRRIGLVTQEVELFRGTLRDNLLTGLAKPYPADESLTAVLSQVGITRPLGEIILENGGNWSGGEKMRIALARELLHDSDILLLDECTASLDDDNCRRILDLVETLFAKKTILAFSHDARLTERFPLHYQLTEGRFIRE